MWAWQMNDSKIIFKTTWLKEEKKKRVTVLAFYSKPLCYLLEALHYRTNLVMQGTKII